MADDVFEITVRTRRPDEWRCVDLRDGTVWRWEPNREPTEFVRSTIPDWIVNNNPNNDSGIPTTQKEG